jgi:exoribonuclease R
LLPELGALLARRAADRGAVNLPLPEQEVEPHGDGWQLVLRAPLAVEEHNAQISLLTGMAAASLMLDGEIGLLRTMPAARPEAVSKLRAAAASLDVSWPDDHSRQWLSSFCRSSMPHRYSRARVQIAPRSGLASVQVVALMLPRPRYRRMIWT